VSKIAQFNSQAEPKLSDQQQKTPLLKLERTPMMGASCSHRSESIRRNNMALQNFTQAKSYETSGSVMEGTPSCPSCHEKMRLSVIAPTMFTVASDHITYTCNRCRIEETRTVQR